MKVRRHQTELFQHIFEDLATDTTKKFIIRASYLEIYNENIRDLLGKDFKQTLEMHVSTNDKAECSRQSARLRYRYCYSTVAVR